MTITKVLAILLACTMLTAPALAGRGGGSFGGSRSFSAPRGPSAPKPSYGSAPVAKPTNVPTVLPSQARPIKVSPPPAWKPTPKVTETPAIKTPTRTYYPQNQTMTTGPSWGSWLLWWYVLFGSHPVPAPIAVDQQTKEPCKKTPDGWCENTEEGAGVTK